METKKEMLNSLKQFRLLAKLILIYFIIYNYYFGWNLHAITDAEKVCDEIFKISLGVFMGFFINLVVRFIEMVTNAISNE